jgi:exonuclease III
MDRSISPPPAKRRKTTRQTPPFPISEAPTTPPDPNTMRIISWNINGIAPFLQKPITSFFQTSSKGSNARNTIPPASLRDFLRRHDWPAMLLLQEVKIARKDLKTQDAVRAAINEPSSSKSSLSSSEIKEPTYEAHFTLPNDPFNARGLRGSGKVYGVCSILRHDLHSKYSIKVRTVAWDNEGRVSVVELTRGDMKVAIFNIYAVNGTDNAYRDTKTGAVRGTRHDRKLAFHLLLMEESKSLEADGWHVLLGGDMNVAPDERDAWPKLRTFPTQHVRNRQDFHEKLLQGKSTEGEGFSGVDVWRATHGEERRYTYYPRGKPWGTSCDRVDYFIAGKSMWDERIVKDSGIHDTEVERGSSDHVPLWIVLTLPT